MNGLGIIQQSDLRLFISYRLKSSEQHKHTMHKKCHFEGDETIQSVFVSETFALKISLFLLLWSLIVCNIHIILELLICFFPCAVIIWQSVTKQIVGMTETMPHPGTQISTCDHSECH
jgi:hypothetical protein